MRIFEKDQDGNIDIAIRALLENRTVIVDTATRQVTGKLFQLFRSSYENHLTAGVVGPMGLVHFFRLTKDDCHISLSNEPTLV